MQMEPQEAVDKLRQTVQVLTAFKSYYFDNKARTLEETPNNPWKFQNSALFGRLDAFLDRCSDVLNLSQTTLQFHKLERVEIGGTKVCVPKIPLRMKAAMHDSIASQCLLTIWMPVPADCSCAYYVALLRKAVTASAGSACNHERLFSFEVLECCAGQNADKQCKADFHRLSDSR